MKHASDELERMASEGGGPTLRLLAAQVRALEDEVIRHRVASLNRQGYQRECKLKLNAYLRFKNELRRMCGERRRDELLSGKQVMELIDALPNDSEESHELV